MERSLPQITHQTNLLWLVLLLLGVTSLQAQSDLDLVEIQSIDPTILVELKYQTSDNLAKKPIYPPEFRAQLRRGVAVKLAGAQRTLGLLGFRLKVWDAYRPMEAQRLLYAVNSDPRYVAAPGQRSMHNRGVAVDVTLTDASGNEVAMPTGFDAMTPAAHYFYDGKDRLIRYRLLALQKAMRENGFFACRTEWWHFFSRDWQKYPNVDTEGLEPGKLIEN